MSTRSILNPRNNFAHNYRNNLVRIHKLYDEKLYGFNITPKLRFYNYRQNCYAR